MAEQNWLSRLEALLFGIRNMLSSGVTVLDANGNPAEYAQLNAVEPLRAAGNPSESRFDLSIDPLALIPTIDDNKTAHVDPTGDDNTGAVGSRTLKFATHEKALEKILLLGPSPATPFLIKTHPGIYSEKPLTLYSGVTWSSTDGPGTVTIQASIATSALVTMQPGSTIKDVTIAGASGAGGVGVLFSAAGTPGTATSLIAGLIVKGCETGVRFTGAAVNAVIKGCDFDPDGVMLVGLEALAGAYVDQTLCRYLGNPGYVLPKAIVADAATVFAGAQTTIAFATSGLYVANNGLIVGNGITLNGCTYPIHISATSGLISVGSAAVVNGGILKSDSATAEIVTGSVAHEIEPQLAAGTKYFGLRFNTVERRVVGEGEVSIGAIGRPAAFAAGGGGLTTAGLVAFHASDVESGPFTDVTDELISASGSAIDLVPDTGAGKALLIGSDEPLPGVFFDVTVAQVGGTLVQKYWNGSAWTPIARWMTTTAAEPPVSSANALFAATGKQNIRWSELSGDVKRTAATGALKHWYVFEVAVDLTTSPKVEHARLHTNHFAISPGGKRERFGSSCEEKRLALPLDTWSTGGGGTAPGTATVNFSNNTSILSPASFVSSPSAREISRRVAVPCGMDTSYPARLVVKGYPTTADTTQLYFTLYYVVVPAGSILNGALAGELNIPLTPNMPGVIGQEITLTYDMLIPGAVAGVDEIAMTLVRVGGDPYAGTWVLSADPYISTRCWR